MATSQVKNRGTVAGNLCRASPAADTAAPLLALEARVKIVGPSGSRIVSLEQFFIGPGETVVDYCETLTEIQIPELPPGAGTALLRVARRAADLAKLNVATMLTVKREVCQDARVALGGVAPTPIRANRAERLLKDNKLQDRLIEKTTEAAAEDGEPITDVRSTKEYRKELSMVLVRRALKISWERAGEKETNNP